MSVNTAHPHIRLDLTYRHCHKFDLGLGPYSLASFALHMQHHIIIRQAASVLLLDVGRSRSNVTSWRFLTVFQPRPPPEPPSVKLLDRR